MDKKDRAAMEPALKIYKETNGERAALDYEYGAYWMSTHKDAHYKPAIDRAVEALEFTIVENSATASHAYKRGEERIGDACMRVVRHAREAMSALTEVTG